MSKDFQWAPAQPTKEMVRAGMGVGEDNCLYWKHPQQAYVDMLAAAPQPPALGGEPEFLGYFYKGDTMGDQFNKLCLKHYYRKPGADEHDYIQPVALIDHAYLAPLQAEIESERALRREMAVRVHQLNDEVKDLTGERDQLKARCDELEADNIKLAADRARLSAEIESLRPAYKSVLAQLDTLSKPAGSEQV